MKATLLLDNGLIFEGTSIGARGTTFAQLCFVNSMTGYQEILTDPSYAQQAIVMTYPEIGNCGINEVDYENKHTFAKGLIIKNYCYEENHYKSIMTLSAFLKENNIIGIADIDTRKLATIIRNEGFINCIITTEAITDEMKKKLENFEIKKDIVKEISKKEKYYIEGENKRIGIIDLGLKNSILKNFEIAGCYTIVFPYNTKSDDILKENLDGLIYSNGVGNPDELKETIEECKHLIGKIPVLGICTGYQVLALALNCELLKMKYPHRGNDYPCINIQTNKVLLVTQNSDYIVNEQTLPKGIKKTYQDLNENYMQGFMNEKLMIEGVQFQPEAINNETDENKIFEKWINKLEDYKKCLKI